MQNYSLIAVRNLKDLMQIPSFGSCYDNMKELRFKIANGVWRIAFAFDPERKAILLVAGNKLGVSQKRFYKQLIAKADKRFEKHLSQLKEKGERDNDNKAE